MGTFVTGNTPLPPLKTDSPNNPPAGLSCEIDAADINTLWSAAGDLRTAITGGGSTLPAPTPTTLGGVKSLAAVAHQFLTQVGTDGAVAQAQAGFSDLSGNIAAAQFPAPYTKWDQESSVNPSVGTFTSFAESGVVGQAFSVDTSAGSSLKISQTAGDSSWGHLQGYLSNAPGLTDYRVRGTFKLKGATFADALNRFGIGARCSVVSNVFSGWGLKFLSGNLYLTKHVSGTQTDYYASGIAIASVLGALQTKDSLLLELDVYGSFVTATANGVVLWRTWDTALAGGVGSVFAEPAASGQNQAIAMVDYFDVAPRKAP